MLDVETRPVTRQTVTPIKPSEALRLGRLMWPKTLGDWFRHGGACALGAMHAGWGGTPADIRRDGYYRNSTAQRLVKSGIDDPDHTLGYMFDDAEQEGRDGDAVVLAYLEERGL